MRIGLLPGSASYAMPRAAYSASARRAFCPPTSISCAASGLPFSQLRKPSRPMLIANSRPARRSLFTETLPTVLVPPAMFVTCLVGLWSYKIAMTIIFQNKFIYMPYLPPFARSEKIEDYAAACKPVQWEERRIRSLDGTRISLGLSVPPPNHAQVAEAPETTRSQVVIIYFHGNGGSLPPRLPALTKVLKSLNECPTPDNSAYSIVALSYRGFWTSKGRASQKGIEQDAQATLTWVQENYPDAQAVLWGHSIGAGVAADLVARQLKSLSGMTKPHQMLPISGLVLETPFIDIKEMLLALYPQKWLPYRYLWPFLRNWWDNDAALRDIAALKGDRRLPIRIITAAEDEIVPEVQAQYLYNLCKDLRLDVRRRGVLKALHNDVPGKLEGRSAIVSFIKEVVA